MRRRVALYGQLPSVRRAAELAQLAKEGNLNRKRFVRSPKPELAASGHRLSPLKNCLTNGYWEHEYSHVTKQAVGAAFTAGVKRLERKYRSWMKQGTLERDWLEFMAVAWAAAAYPSHMRTQAGSDPELVCFCAARRAGEVDFCQRILLPFLTKQKLRAKILAVPVA
jgi:hypothetical protein